MENVHARRRQRCEEFAQRFWSGDQARGVVLLLPLREAEDDRETLTDGCAHCLINSMAKRERLARLPPYSSVRWLLPSQKNWSIR